MPRAEFEVQQADVLDALRAMPSASFDACFCDPPYGLSFMGHAWDHGVPSAEVWAEVLRVLKPGAFLLAFGGTRTFHRLACAVEDAGFEVRDCLIWLHGQGFPKSLDLSKAIDEELGAERDKIRLPAAQVRNQKSVNGGHGIEGGDRPYIREAQERGYHEIASNNPVTDQAKVWDGWGTALKPAWEPASLAMKPIAGTFAGNALEHGTGGLNVRGGRIGETKDVPTSPAGPGRGVALEGSVDGSFRNCTGQEGGFDPNLGRWPSNVVLDGAAADMLDEQAGETSTPETVSRGRSRTGAAFSIGKSEEPIPVASYGDEGGVSRYFKVTGREGEESAGRRYAVRGVTDMAATPGPRGGAAEGRWPANVVLSHLPGCREVGTRQVRSGAAGGRTGAANVMLHGLGAREEPWGTYAGEDGLEEVPAFECAPGCPVAMLDEQSGELQSGSLPAGTARGSTNQVYGEYAGLAASRDYLPNSGGASRFFYCAKAPRAEREAGLEAMEPAVEGVWGGEEDDLSEGKGSTIPRRNNHSTVKPLDLCRYFATLLLVPERSEPRRILVPFSGSGSEMIGCALAGWEQVVGIEREARWCEIARRRLKWWIENPPKRGEKVSQAASRSARRAQGVDRRQIGLFGEEA